MHLALRKYVWVRSLPAVLTVLFLFAVTCCVSLTTHAAQTQCSHPKDACYRVAIGDTFSGFAARYNISLDELETYNKNIPHPGLIFPMQLICIPSSLQRGVRVPAPVSSDNTFVAARLDADSAGVPMQIFVNQIYQESGSIPCGVACWCCWDRSILAKYSGGPQPASGPARPVPEPQRCGSTDVSLPSHVQQHCDGTRGLQCGSSNSDERRRNMWGSKLPKLPPCRNDDPYPRDYE